MDVVRRARAMRDACAAARAAGKIVGFVPTMGALHDGHVALVRRVKAQADLTAVSIFVNPTQFNSNDDFARYPRDLSSDADVLVREGVDLLFAPDVEEMFPPHAATFVEVAGLSDKLEGKSRPGHFRGVATVVTKLLEIVNPHLAAFGQKDAQQALIVKTLVRDLMLNVEVLVLPTLREPDGLAMSSRNVQLSEDERRAAGAIPRALDAAAASVAAGERDPGTILATARAVLAGEPLLKVDYVELVDPERLDPVTRLPGESLLVVAVFAGATRLIDNVVLRS
jgi:pantoate--beta-alanine ligase